MYMSGSVYIYVSMSAIFTLMSGSVYAYVYVFIYMHTYVWKCIDVLHVCIIYTNLLYFCVLCVITVFVCVCLLSSVFSVYVHNIWKRVCLYACFNVCLNVYL